MRRLLIVILALLPVFALGQIYKSVDKYGNVQFSDTPQKGSTPVDLPKPQTFTPPPTSTLPQPATPQPQDTKPFKYTSVQITNPPDDGTLRDNSGNMNVSVSIQPALRPEDKVQLLLDDRPIGAPQSVTQFQLQNVNRGTHILQAKILDKNNKTIATSDTVTFHMHQAHITPGGIRSELETKAIDLQEPSAFALLQSGFKTLTDPNFKTLKNPKEMQNLVAQGLQELTNPPSIPLQQPLTSLGPTLQEKMELNKHHQNKYVIVQGDTPDYQTQGALPKGAHYQAMLQGQTPDVQVQGSIPQDQLQGNTPNHQIQGSN